MLDLSSVTPLRTDPYPFTELQEKCLRDLETTDAPQARYALENERHGFCCLGRFCVAAGAERIKTDEIGIGGGNLIEYVYAGKRCRGYLPVTLGRALLLHERRGYGVAAAPFKRPVYIPGKGPFDKLTVMNDAPDGERLTFKEIAQYIRHDPWNVFRDPAESDGAQNG